MADLKNTRVYGDLNVDYSASIRNLTVAENTVIGGNLTVNGTTSYINTEDLKVKDKLIEIAEGVNLTASLDGAGVQFGVTSLDINLKYFGTDDVFRFSRPISAPEVVGYVTTEVLEDYSNQIDSRLSLVEKSTASLNSFSSSILSFSSSINSWIADTIYPWTESIDDYIENNSEWRSTVEGWTDSIGNWITNSICPWTKSINDYNTLNSEWRSTVEGWTGSINNLLYNTGLLHWTGSVNSIISDFGSWKETVNVLLTGSSEWQSSSVNPRLESLERHSGSVDKWISSMSMWTGSENSVFGGTSLRSITASYADTLKYVVYDREEECIRFVFD